MVKTIAKAVKLRTCSEHIEPLDALVRRALKYKAAINARLAANPSAKKVHPCPPIAGIAAAMNITVQIITDMMIRCHTSVLT